MSGRDRTGVGLAALAVSMGAMCNALDPLDVDVLVVHAGQILPEGDELRHAVTAFAAQYMICRYEPEALFREGKALGRAVELAAMPVPPDTGRADING